MTERTQIANTKPYNGSPLGRALDVIGTIIITLAIVLVLSLSVPKLFGITEYTVLTGSMEPTIPVGSLVIAKSVDPVSLQGGDVAVFYDGMSTAPITHRVISNNYDDRTINTQGDANSAPDVSPVPYQNIIGKMILCIPVAGSLLIPLNSLQGKLCLISIILGAMLLCLAGRGMMRNKRRNK